MIDINERENFIPICAHFILITKLYFFSCKKAETWPFVVVMSGGLAIFSFVLKLPSMKAGRWHYTLPSVSKLSEGSVNSYNSSKSFINSLSPLVISVGARFPAIDD